MYARLGSYITKGVGTVSGPFHPFGGAVDIVVVEQQDGSFKSSPWYVRFGKFQGVLKAKEKVVTITVNGVQSDFDMYLDHKGEAYFLKEVDVEGESGLSPSSSGEETDGHGGSRRPMKSISLNYDDKLSSSVTEIDVSNLKLVTRTSSRRSRIMGLVFGRKARREKSFHEEDDGAGVVRADSLERAEIAADLLEVKWSTNLASGRHRKDNASRFSASDVADSEANKDFEIDDGPRQVDSLAHDEVTDTLENLVPHEVCSGVDMSCLIVESHFRSGNELNSEMSRKIKEIGKANDVENGKAVTSEISCPGSKSPDSDSPEACSSQELAQEHACHGEDSGMSGNSMYEEENGVDRIQSFTYPATSENSEIRLDDISCGNCEEVPVHVETFEKISEVNSQPETGTLVSKGSSNIHEIAGDENCCSFFDDAKLLESQRITSCTNCILKETYSETLAVYPVNGSANEVESCSDCTISSVSNSIFQGRDDKNSSEEDKIDKIESSLGDVDSQKVSGDFGIAEALNLSASEGLEEEQFLFGELDDGNLSRVKSVESISSDPVEKENHSSVTRKNTEAVKKSISSKCEKYSSRNNYVQKDLPYDVEELTEKSKLVSRCIDIPASKAAGQEVGQIVKSLPNMYSHIDEVDAHHIQHVLGHSLDSNSKSSKWKLPRKDVSSCIESDVDRDYQLSNPVPTVGDAKTLEELRNLPASPAVEDANYYVGNDVSDKYTLPLHQRAWCKEHGLILHTMSRSCEDIEGWAKYSLNVGHFAFSLIVQSISLHGIKDGPDAAIRCDWDLSKSFDASSGSWRRWSFPFKKSTSMDVSQPDSDCTKSFDAENALESTGAKNEEKDVPKPKVNKKRIRIRIPTSEQLASLNLKEGPNKVSFTYWTSMLGEQQVDARIYLWRWDMRVVISDVDGTITK
ncbi:hypothetical protein RJ639_027671 [Escallonia herrerae]|uniref:Phosphatidate phosphatase n=1 Tax=Escallonia herrerae TaxID=1293975 RepID=A0AA89BK33_9ASTE|nr:hypothetical protein RJ639_027671 [Escallonia herrerae]